MEIWKPIKGYEGLYEVSDGGSIRRIAPAVGTKPGYMLTPGRMPGRGYRIIALCRSPQDHRCFRVARLVGKAFLGPPPSRRHQINHKNGVTYDDRVVNLEWVTPSENMRHRYAVLGQRAPRGEQHHNSILTERQVAIMKAMRRAGASNGAIAQQFGKKLITVKQVTNGRNWGHIAPSASIPSGYRIAALPVPSGSHHHNSKLTEEAVRFIRASLLPGVELADRFKVSGTVITNVQKRRTWRHVA